MKMKKRRNNKTASCKWLWHLSLLLGVRCWLAETLNAMWIVNAFRRRRQNHHFLVASQRRVHRLRIQFSLWKLKFTDDSAHFIMSGDDVACATTSILRKANVCHGRQVRCERFRILFAFIGGIFDLFGAQKFVYWKKWRGKLLSCLRHLKWNASSWSNNTTTSMMKRDEFSCFYFSEFSLISHASFCYFVCDASWKRREMIVSLNK